MFSICVAFAIPVVKDRHSATAKNSNDLICMISAPSCIGKLFSKKNARKRKLPGVFLARIDYKPLQLARQYLLMRIVHRARRQCHVSDTRVLCARAGHTGAVGDKHVGHCVYLVPLVEHAGFWVVTHARGAHLVNTGDRKSTRLNSSHVKISY